jgi:hypothetical protein
MVPRGGVIVRQLFHDHVARGIAALIVQITFLHRKRGRRRLQ